MRLARIALVVLALGGAARADEVSADELLARLKAARRCVEDELEKVRGAEDPDLGRLRGAAKPLAGVRVKVGPSSFAADPHLDDDIAALEKESTTLGREERLAVLGKRLGTLERDAERARELVKAAPTPSPTPDRPVAPTAQEDKGAEKAALDRVLEAPRYRKRSGPAKSAMGDWFDSQLQRLENFYLRLLQPGPAPAPPSWLTSILAFLGALVPTTMAGWVGLCLVVLVLVVLVFLWRRRRGGAASPEEKQGEAVVLSRSVAAVDPLLSEEEWRLEAKKLAGQGDVRGAVRALYTGLLISLHRAGRLRFEKGRTNWEHVRELRRNDRPLATRMEPLTRTFDLVWYGKKPVETRTYDDFLSEVDAIADSARKVEARA